MYFLTYYIIICFMKWLKLSQWAEQNSYFYHGAYNIFHNENIVSAFKIAENERQKNDSEFDQWIEFIR